MRRLRSWRVTHELDRGTAGGFRRRRGSLHQGTPKDSIDAAPLSRAATKDPIPSCSIPAVHQRAGKFHLSYPGHVTM